MVCDDDSTFAHTLCGQIEAYCQSKKQDCSAIPLAVPDDLLKTDLSGIDALFLDIEMPRLSGLEAARQIRAGYPDLLIIFVTSYLQYAPEGYEVRAFRYLLKKDLDLQLPRCLEDIQASLDSACQILQIHTADREQSIPLPTLVYAEGTAKRHVLLHLSSQDQLSCLEYVGLLSELENHLKDCGFLRVQRSYLVNMKHIEKINNYYAFLSTGERLKVSVQNYRDIRRQFLLWKGRHV